MWDGCSTGLAASYPDTRYDSFLSTTLSFRLSKNFFRAPSTLLTQSLTSHEELPAHPVLDRIKNSPGKEVGQPPFIDLATESQGSGRGFEAYKAM